MQPSELTIDSLIVRRSEIAAESHVSLAPDRKPLSYAGLLEQVRYTAGCLRTLGIGRGDRVAVVLPNGPEMAAAFLGIASAAVCAPLNPAYGAREFEFYLSDLRASALVAEEGEDSAAVETARKLGVPVVRLHAESGWEAGRFTLDRLPQTPAVEPSRPDDVALVLHTSGTTARPKIVPLTHGNLCTSAENIRRSLMLSEPDRCLNVMPLFHIHGLAGALLSSVAAGGSVVLTPGFAAPAFFGWVEQFRPTWYTAVPAIHRDVATRAGANSGIIARNPLRFIRSCSSALAPTLMIELESAFHAPVIEAYGMTEAAHQVASNPLPPQRRKPGSVGVAGGPEIAVMSGAGDLLAHGQTGEIVIRGANVMRGYEDNAAANQAAFHDGWFRTGDQGYLDDEGYVVLTGRIKELINRGGEKIAPREIDEALLSHPEVLQAVAFAVPHADLGEEVAAAVVLRPGSPLAPAQIREHAAARLAAFKVPRVVRILDEIPKGPTGKVQRIGLAEKLGIGMIDPRNSARAAFVAPRNPLETRLAGTWRALLAVEEPGVDDDFFALGGGSLSAMQLMSLVRSDFQADVPLLRFLDNPTIAILAAEIEKCARGGGAADDIVPIQPQGTLPPLYCAPSHRDSLLLFCRLARYLEPDRPLFGFALPAMTGDPHCYRIEEVAARYIGQIRKRQPKGPYYLAGYCFGGFITFEMARQFQQQGDTVAFLGMIDTFNAQGMGSRPRELWSRFNYHWQDCVARPIPERLVYMADWVRVAACQWLFDLCARRAWRVPGFLRDISYASSHARMRYRPGRYDGAAALFSSRRPSPDTPDLGWSGTITGGLDVFERPPDQRGVISEASVRLLGTQFGESLRRAQRHSAQASAAVRD